MSAGEKDALERLAENIRLRRQELCVTQEDLAFRVDIHRTQISGIESGRRAPRVMTFLKLCGGLELSPNELLDGIAWDSGALYKGTFQVADREGQAL